MLRKCGLALLACSLIASSLAGLTGCSGKESVTKYDTLRIGTFYTDECNFSIHYADAESLIFLVDSGTIIESKKCSIDPREGINVLESADPSVIELQLESLDTVEPKDTKLNEEIVRGACWAASLKESTAHLKYLQTQGYKIDSYGSSIGYIEVYMSNSTATKQKRLLITSDRLMEADVIEPKDITYKRYINY